MRVVAHKTGLTPEILRAWERRYPGISPDRDGKGRRVYSEELMERLILLSILVDQGFRIGEVVEFSADDLRRTVEAISRERPEEIVPQPCLEAAEEAVLAFDDRRLWNEMEHAVAVQGRLAVHDEFLFPLTHRIEKLQEQGLARSVHLSFLRSTLRTFLSSLLTPVAGESSMPVVVIAYPLGQEHDIGGLASAAHCHAAGWHPILLGTNVASEEIAEAAIRLEAQAVLLSSVSKFYDTRLLNEFARVRRNLDKRIPIYFGGHLPRPMVDDIASLGLIALSDMETLRQEFQELAEAVA